MYWSFNNNSLYSINGYAVGSLPPQAAIKSHLRVQSLQLPARVCGFELTVGFGVVLVAVILPCVDFVGEDFLVGAFRPAGRAPILRPDPSKLTRTVAVEDFRSSREFLPGVNYVTRRDQF
jgi:hypothetical protein